MTPKKAKRKWMLSPTGIKARMSPSHVARINRSNLAPAPRPSGAFGRWQTR